MGSSLSPRATDDVRRADDERERRNNYGLVFPSVRHALGFFFERGPAMQSPLPQHPRGHRVPGSDETVYVQVDGGRPSDPHDIHATLLSISKAMWELKKSEPVRYELLVLHVRDGKAFAELGKAANRAPSTVSADIGRAESFLLGWLRRDGIVIPARADG